MKRNSRNLILMLALGGIATLSPLSRAEDAPEKPAAKAEAGAAPKAGPARDRMKQMADELKLNEDQKAKLKPIMREQAEKTRQIQADTALSAEDKRAKAKEIRDASAAKIKEILTPEQYEQWQKLQKERGPQPPRRKKQQAQ